jgi:AAA family ATP:ADP antiporter
MAAPPATWPRRFARMIEKIVGSDVHDGEWSLVLLCFANLFLLLAAYYILKVIREPLILLSGGAVTRSYARGLQAGLLALLIPCYSLLANRFEPDRLVKWIMTFFVGCLGLFWVLGRLGVPLGFVFFVWLGMFSTLAIAQFWALAVDVMSESEGKRLFPMIAAGGTVGGIAGAQIAARAITWLAPTQLMLIAAAMLAGCAILTHLTHGAGTSHRLRKSMGAPPSERDRRGGFTLVVRDRYLLLIGLSVVLLNLVNTTGDFLLAQLVNAKALTMAVGLRRGFVGAFYGDFQTWVSVLTALIQILLVSRVFKLAGVGGAVLFLPLVAVGGYGASVFAPALALVATVKVVENSTDYSLQNTLQQALFLPTSRDAKYKAKSAIDTVSVRLGDLASTGLVFVGVRLGFATYGYAIANVVAGLVWLALVIQLRRRHAALVPQGDAEMAAAAAAPDLEARLADVAVERTVG